MNKESNRVRPHLFTVFTQSDTVATIYFIAQFCVASIQEWRLLILVDAREAIRRETVMLDIAKLEDSDPFADVEGYLQTL